MKKVLIVIAMSVGILGSAWAASYVVGPSMPQAQAGCSGHC